MQKDAPLAASPITYEDDPLVRRLEGLYRLADPKIALASVVPLIAGAAVAIFDGGDSAILFLMALVAIFCVEVGKNCVNDFFDFRSGADTGVRPEERSPFSGGKRVLVDGILTEGELIANAFMALALGFVFGLYVVFMSDPRLFLLGTIAAAIAVAYTAPPFSLSYRGFGEAAVFLTYGPGIVLGSELLFAHRVTRDGVAASIGLGFLIANVLLVNELPDERADREAGKRTLVVRLGRRKAIALSAALFVLAFLAPVVATLLGGTPRTLGLLAGVPFAASAIADLGRGAGPVRVKSQIATLAAYVAAGAGLVAAFLL